MDTCCCRSNTYDVINRNKAPFLRPVVSGSTTNLTVAFNKMAAVHTQVSHRGSALSDATRG